MYSYIKETDGKLDEELTLRALSLTYQNLTDWPSEWIKVVFDAAHRYARTASTKKLDQSHIEYECLFFLARSLMARTPEEHRRERNREQFIAPLALVYAERLRGIRPDEFTTDTLDWDDADDVMEIFKATYPVVIYAEGESLLQTVAAKANAQPLRLKEQGAKFITFLSIAYHMQVIQGDRDILLPVKRLAPIIGTSEMFISKLRIRATQLGFIQEKGKHNKRAHKATPFRFNLEKLTVAQRPKKTTL